MGLELGDMVGLSPGPDAVLYWKAQAAARGRVIGFIPAQPSRPEGAAVVELEQEIEVQQYEAPPVRGRYVVLSTRWKGQTWDPDDNTVHFELCESEPPDLPDA